MASISCSRPFSTLNNSAMCHVHGTVGPAVTLRPSGRLEMTRRAGVVIEKRKRDDEAALLIDDQIAPIADPHDEVQQA